MNVRPLHQSVRPSPVFLVIVAVTVAGGALAWWCASDTDRPLSYVAVFTFVIAGWVVSLCVHEFAHAYTAWRFGDRDVEVRGYLTLNPLRYSNPMLSIGLPVLVIAIGGVGLPGGAVYVRTGWMTPRQRSLVSLAGPATNLVFAALLLVLANLLYDPAHGVFWAGVAFLGFLQVTAVVLNMLPVPGLDGYGALEPHLSPQTQRALAPAKQWGLLVLLLLLFTPNLNRWFWSVVLWFFDFSGVPRPLVWAGGALTRFWSAWF
ncbi:peptidase M50 [Mycolicibacterium phlei]|uniref:Membrane protein n=1 Tax=Mycolicibacterium phlei DSM 43239 = CCUG 21000 TaxID=1226750 RepID=A0A5N5VFV9_MYCPH|nr:site-2 protease family protein [Mycolicibacterium phlei]VEG11546.1 peptidase M50 [Mycobacteroides chelonae]AMO63452.1 Peptidase family M50 [Mycolicibacterium phlei]EID14533.1 peptidase, M50B family protein [Mycolicibacterium phlei RIVM601174]KAB7759697.1 membrane protein [Mycolicibacterium phlei DSM 43239 = CCUG 21000]KXW68742.1 membrane protein [Mycolicibacterium phlei DSM 43239 = CCUG 21000]